MTSPQPPVLQLIASDLVAKLRARVEGDNLSMALCDLLMDNLVNHRWVYEAEILRWVDADTVDLRVLENVDFGFRIKHTFTFEDRFRLVTEDGGWYDAPEMRGSERSAGMRATEAVKAALPEGSFIVVRTFRDKRGKYGRWLAHVPGAIEAANAALRDHIK